MQVDLNSSMSGGGGVTSAEKANGENGQDRLWNAEKNRPIITPINHRDIIGVQKTTNEGLKISSASNIKDDATVKNYSPINNGKSSIPDAPPHATK